LISKPLPDQELLDRIDRFCRDDVRDRILTQEVLLYLGILVRARPALFQQLSTVRVSHIIGLLTSQLSKRLSLPVEDAFDALLNLPPLELKSRLEKVLERYGQIESLPQQLEHLGSTGSAGVTEWREDLGLSRLPEPDDGWLAWRQHLGIVDRRPADFYMRTWRIFRHVPCLVIGDKLDRKNRLESRLIVSDMTPGEKGFALLIEHLLNKIVAAEYRQLTMETLTLLWSFFEQNPDLKLTETLYIDAIVGHAVRLHYLGVHPEREATYGELKVEAWRLFYASSPQATSAALAQALRFLLDLQR
jgi:phosphorylase kinase alpha/beta subunit